MEQDESWDETAAMQYDTPGEGMFAPEVLGIWPAELDLMGRLAGFELEARYADWDRSEFTAESRSQVSVYRLPASA